MNKEEANSIFESEVERFRTMPYDEFVRTIKNDVYTAEHVGLGPKSVGFLLFHDFVIVPASGVTPAGNSPWGLIGLWQKVDLLNPGSTIKAHYDDLWSLFGSALPNL